MNKTTTLCQISIKPNKMVSNNSYKIKNLQMRPQNSKRYIMI